LFRPNLTVVAFQSPQSTLNEDVLGSN
jgi:hypothetical protein